MKIVLVRHGRPDFLPTGKVKAYDVGALVEQYNAAGLSKDSSAPAELVTEAQTCNAAVCSHLPRSLQSARALGLNSLHLSDPLFREVELPYAAFPFIPLSPYGWFLFFRLLWFVGFSSNGESLPSARIRARAAALRLQEVARESKSVVFIGHGLINTMIARELRIEKWRGP